MAETYGLLDGLTLSIFLITCISLFSGLFKKLQNLLEK